MEWNKNISLTDIISILALVATFVAILLMLIQRHDLSRPFVCIRTNSSETCTLLSNLGLDIKSHAIDLSCIGNNVAQNICLEAYFCMSHKIMYDDTIAINRGFCEFKKDNCAICFSLHPIKIGFSIINGNETVNLANDLVGHILGIAILGYDSIKMAIKNNDSNFYSPNIIISIVYEDVLGKHYHKYFMIASEFCIIQNDNYTFRLNSRIISKKTFNRMLKEDNRI